MDKADYRNQEPQEPQFQALKREMREQLDTAAQFEEILTRFLDWRRQYDEDVRLGRARPEVDEADLVEAA